MAHSKQDIQPTQDEIDCLKWAEIIGDRDDPDNHSAYVNRSVNLEQTAIYLGWADNENLPNTKRVREELHSGRLGRVTWLGLGYRITVRNLIEYKRGKWRTSRTTLIRDLRDWLEGNPLLVFLGLLIGVLGILAQVYAEPLRWFFSPPRYTLTLILDASEPMAEQLYGGLTRWQIAISLAKNKLPPPVLQAQEEVAVWVQRGQRNAEGSVCTDKIDLRTNGYVPANRLDLDAALQDVELYGFPNPGHALEAAVARMPRFSLHQTRHQAVVLSSSSRTCSGLRPADEVCGVLKKVADRWQTWSNSQLTHEITVIDLDAGRVGTNPIDCREANTIVRRIDLDPEAPEESNRELCKTDARLCSIFVIPVEDGPAPTPVRPGATPKLNLSVTPTPSQVSGHPQPSPIPTPTKGISTPISSAAPQSTPLPTSPYASPAATSAPVLRLRAFSGKTAAVTEGCHQGRVIGAIGEIERQYQQLEAEVVSVPDDLRFLSGDGCVRVFTGILGEPTRGFRGYLQASDVCIVRAGYDYWRTQRSFQDVPGIEQLRPCPD